jgi:hypothetical protein
MNVPLSDPVRITAWPDEVIDRIGHQPDSAYFEWLWLLIPSDWACHAPRAFTARSEG